MHLHVGTEAPGLDDRVALASEFDHPLVEHLPPVRGGGTREARPAAAARVGRERELADDQQATSGVGEAAVHPAAAVGQDAQPEQLVDQTHGLGLAVCRLRADEGQQAASDRPHHLAGDLDPGLANALDEGDHSRSGGS